MLKTKKVRFLLTISIALLCSVMILFSVTTPASALTPIKKLPGAEIDCDEKVHGPGWMSSDTGGYVGPQTTGGDCDGSYRYVKTPTKNFAHWVLPGSKKVTTSYLWVYFPTDRAGAKDVTYTVKTDKGTWTFKNVNQRGAAGWKRLGTFTFGPADIHVCVHAGPTSKGEDLLADAVGRRSY